MLKTLKEQFSPCYDKPVLQLVHHSKFELSDQMFLSVFLLNLCCGCSLELSLLM